MKNNLTLVCHLKNGETETSNLDAGKPSDLRNQLQKDCKIIEQIIHDKNGKKYTIEFNVLTEEITFFADK